MKNPGHKKLHLVITKSNWGGAQRYVFDLATQLKNEYDVSVIAGGEGELITKLKEAGINVISIPFLQRDISFVSDFKTALFLWKLFRKEKPDIVHLNSSKIGGLGSFVARLARVPRIIFTLHGLALNENRSKLSKLVIWKLYWLTVLFCHKTIAVSDALARQSKKLFPLLSKKIVVVKNAIAQPNFVSREDARTLLGIPEDVFAFGIIAELHPIKGHRYLIEGFVQFLKTTNAPFKYTLILIGEGQERKNIESLIASLGLNDRVKICGHVSSASTYLKALDVFVLTSLSEGLAYVALEAGNASLPVIATNVGGLPEIIIDNETGLLIPSKNAEAIAGAMKKLADNQTLREKLAAHIKQKVSTEFSIEKMVRKTKNVY